MLKIRLQRTGRINKPSYRVVVTEQSSGPKAGKAVEFVGHYDPTTKKRELREDRIKYWISVGAQPSETMHNMLIDVGMLKGKKINVLPKKTVAKVEEPVAAAPAAAAVAATAEETPEVTDTAPEAATE